MTQSESLRLGDLELELATSRDAPPALAALRLGGRTLIESASGRVRLPLVELQTDGHGREGSAGKRHVDGPAGRALRYVSHHVMRSSHGDRLEVLSRGDGLEVTSTLTVRDGIPVLRLVHEVQNIGDSTIELQHVSSFAASGVLARHGDWESVALWTAANPWSGEGRWRTGTLEESGLVDVGMVAFGQVGTKNRIERTSTGSWSTSEHLAMAGLQDPTDGAAILWQIEHNGSWHWEIADRYDDLYLVVSGPTESDNQWTCRLKPGDTFETVPASVAFSLDGVEGAAGALTRYARSWRRPHPDHDGLPVIFNDFMNCLMGEPTTGALEPLICAAAEAGAEVFCIDAGWYDDRSDWWDAVGEWQACEERFPGGLGRLLDQIRDRGMVPGLWLEPEVVGVRSRIASQLPDEAFFVRDGGRVTEWGRHQLDFRHPAARAHLDEVVDRLVSDWGIGYLKLDYNIDIGPGTDVQGESTGAGLLGHNRAYLGWLDSVMDRHPALVIENCAAGGMRTDFAMLSRLPVHSVTDQQDWRLMPAIAAAAPAAVTPEQGAIWAYPHRDLSDDEIAFTMASAMLGRIHLSGRIDLLDSHQMAIVQEAITAYRGYRQLLTRLEPRWPLGLPGWRDGWLALALSDETTTLLTIWRRDTEAAECTMPLAWLEGRDVEVRRVYPTASPGSASWVDGFLTVELPQRYSAQVLELRSS
jgi:alpha-galactosidase